LTDKGVRGRDKLKREDTFPFNDRTVFVIRSPLDGLSLDDMMKISNQERVPCTRVYPSHARSKLYFYLLPPTDAYRRLPIEVESEQGLRGEHFLNKEGGDMGSPRSLLHFGQSPNVCNLTCTNLQQNFSFSPAHLSTPFSIW
jgi:hypothetical protein